MTKSDAINPPSDDQGVYTNDNTALLLAAREGRHKEVELLLEKRKDIDGNTALLLAVRYGHKKVVELLLEKRKDIDVNLQDKYGNTLLIYAAICGFEEIVELLLEKRKDIDVNIKDKLDDTAFDIAISKKYIEIAKKLVRALPNTDFMDVSEINYSFNPGIKYLYDQYNKALKLSETAHDPINHSEIIIGARCVLTFHCSDKKLAALMDSFRLHANTILKTADRGNEEGVVQSANGYKHLIRKIVSKYSEHHNPKTLHRNIGFFQKNKVKRVINNAIFEKEINNALNDKPTETQYKSLLNKVRHYIGSSEIRLEEFKGYINRIADNLNKKTAIKPVKWWSKLNFFNPFGRKKRYIQEEINKIIRKGHVAKKPLSPADDGQAKDNKDDVSEASVDGSSPKPKPNIHTPLKASTLDSSVFNDGNKRSR